MITRNYGTAFILCLLFVVVIGDGRSCSMKALSGSSACGDNEVCDQFKPNDDRGLCRCVSGYKRQGDRCEAGPTPMPQPRNSTVQPPSAEPHTGHPSKNAVVAGVLVPLLLISAVVASLVYLGRRHGWMQRLRQLRPVAQRRNNDFLIGRPDDDDDPIA
ncbi:hypothetical protein B566_EDAN012504 [Ephemera danica]|nr:hypothetical protein B566_EDAN012504 [Ephemera danica]